MTKNNNESLAATEFIKFIESGNYQEMKQTEIFLKQAKSHMKDMLSAWEGKRHEFKNLNMVAKFVPKKVYETNHAGLIDELLCYVRHDLVFPLVRLDSKEIKENGISDTLQDYLHPRTFYIRPTLNKVGKKKVSLYEYLLGGQSEEELITDIRDSSLKHKELEIRYEKFKSTVQHCPILKEKKKVNTTYGSISLCPNKEQWDLPKIYDDYGENYLVNYGKVDMAKLDELILEGAVPKSIISAHRKIIDIRLDFVVMQLDVENKVLKMQREKQVQASLRRLA